MQVRASRECGGEDANDESAMRSLVIRVMIRDSKHRVVMTKSHGVPELYVHRR